MAPGGSQRGQTLRSLPRLSGLGLFMSIVLFACGARRAHALSWPSSQRPAPLSLRSPGDSPHRPGSSAPLANVASPEAPPTPDAKEEAAVSRRRAGRKMGGKSVLSSGSEVAEIGAGAGLKEKRDWGRMLEGMQEIASYKVTQMLGASTMVKLISLMLFSVFLVIAGGALIKYNQEGLGWGESLFKAYALLNNAPGTSAVDEADEVSSLIVNAIYIIGILTFATALGVITSSMELALERILADDHKIIEKNHILVLNWNEMVPPMVRQIAAAIGDGVAPHCPIVILADKDQKQMKDALDAALPPGHRLELMIRSGNPGTLSGLEKVSAGLARFVVVLTPEGRGSTPEDLPPLRALLTTQAACLRSLQRRRQPKTNVGALPEDIHVVVTAPYQEGAQGLFRYCFYQQRNLQQRVLALSTLQPGLARVHEEIFDQEKGCQLYLHPAARWPWILNSTFAEASQHFPSAVLLGWVTAGPAPKVTINPPAEQPIPYHAPP